MMREHMQGMAKAQTEKAMEDTELQRELQRIERVLAPCPPDSKKIVTLWRGSSMIWKRRDMDFV